MPHLNLRSVIHKWLLHLMSRSTSIAILLPISTVHLHAIRRWWYYTCILVDVVVLLLLQNQPLLLLLTLHLKVLNLGIDLVNAVAASAIMTLAFHVLPSIGRRMLLL